MCRALALALRSSNAGLVLAALEALAHSSTAVGNASRPKYVCRASAARRFPGKQAGLLHSSAVPAAFACRSKARTAAGQLGCAAGKLGKMRYRATRRLGAKGEGRTEVDGCLQPTALVLCGYTYILHIWGRERGLLTKPVYFLGCPEHPSADHSAVDLSLWGPLETQELFSSTPRKCEPGARASKPTPAAADAVDEELRQMVSRVKVRFPSLCCSCGFALKCDAVYGEGSVAQHGLQLRHLRASEIIALFEQKLNHAALRVRRPGREGWGWGRPPKRVWNAVGPSARRVCLQENEQQALLVTKTEALAQSDRCVGVEGERGALAS
jgi:hypothetical protein